MPSKTDELLETFGAPVLDEYFGVSIVLKRGAMQTEPITATFQDQDYQVEDQNNFLTTVQRRDFMFAVAAAAIRDSAIEPQPYDKIISDEGIFEVTPLGKKPAAEKLPGGYRWLVHTQRVS